MTAKTIVETDFEYKTISSSLPATFDTKLNKAVDDGCIILENTYRVAARDTGMVYSILTKRW